MKGSRYFDIRVMNVRGELRAYHSMGDSRSLGGASFSLTSMIHELKDFVHANNTEFVIERLSHLKDTKEILQFVYDWDVAITQQNGRSYLYKGTGNLALKTVAELAGHIILVAEAKKLKEKNKVTFLDDIRVVDKSGQVTGLGVKQIERVPAQTDGFHHFYANKKGKPLENVSDGLCVCGEFSGKTSLDEIIKKQLTEYDHHDTHKACPDDQSHLYCLYWTATLGGGMAMSGSIEAETQKLRTDEAWEQVTRQLKPKALREFDHTLELTFPGSRAEEFQKINALRRNLGFNSCSVPNIVL